MEVRILTKETVGTGIFICKGRRDVAITVVVKIIFHDIQVSGLIIKEVITFATFQENDIGVRNMRRCIKEAWSGLKENQTINSITRNGV